MELGTSKVGCSWLAPRSQGSASCVCGLLIAPACLFNNKPQVGCCALHCCRATLQRFGRLAEITAESQRPHPKQQQCKGGPTPQERAAERGSGATGRCRRAVPPGHAPGGADGRGMGAPSTTGGVGVGAKSTATSLIVAVKRDLGGLLRVVHVLEVRAVQLGLLLLHCTQAGGQEGQPGWLASDPQRARTRRAQAPPSLRAFPA